MQQMNGQCFDFTEEEVDQIQEILEFEYDDGSSDEDVRDNDSASIENTYENNADCGGTLNGSSNRDEILEQASIDNNDIAYGSDSNGLSAVYATNDNLNGGEISDDSDQNASFQWICNPTDYLHKPLDSKIEVELFEKAYDNSAGCSGTTLDGTANGDKVSEQESNGNVDISSGNGANGSNTAGANDGILNRNEISEQESNENNNIPNESDDGSSTVDSTNGNLNQDETSGQTDSNCNTPVAVSINLARIKKEKGSASNANCSGITPIFSPPSASSNIMLGQIPAHFARLDPSLYDALSGQGKDESNGGQSQMSSIQNILDHVPTVFPGSCSYVR